MALKTLIHSLHEPTDLALLITDQLHHEHTVSGFKRKNLLRLVDTFAIHGYKIMLHFTPGPFPEFDLLKAGRLSTHFNLPFTLPLNLLPVSNQFELHDDKKAPKPSFDTALEKGQQFFRSKLPALQNQIPDDWQHVCEFVGRLALFTSITNWQWYLCTKSGTTINIHFQPDACLDPVHLLQAQFDCTRARINTINVFPLTVEVIFHAFTKIERLPFNRRHRPRFTPYARK